MNTVETPKWIKWFALLVLLGQIGAVGLMLAGRLPGAARNLVPQALLGGAMVLFVVAAYLLRHHSVQLWPAPVRLGVALLTLLALSMAGLHLWGIRPLLELPYDLACWSEPFFLIDIIKIRTGASFYQPEADSNSSVYTPGTAVVSYALAKLAGRPTSVAFYRLLEQLYLFAAALLAAAAACNLLRIVVPTGDQTLTRRWFLFFALAAFVFQVNTVTGAFTVFLHNDAMVMLFTAFAFFVLTRHALAQSPRWLWLMAVIPAVGFFVKQYIAIWAAVYVIYLWLEGHHPLRRVIVFGAVAFGLLFVSVGLSLAVWGVPFRYWIFQSMGQWVVSFERIIFRSADAAIPLLPGLAGGWLLLRGEGFRRLLALWVGWPVMVLGGMYTSGITFSPTHLNPAALVGFCFFLAALGAIWPVSESQGEKRAQDWLQIGLVFAAVLWLFGALGMLQKPPFNVSPDLNRYIAAIEKEFQDLPAERVLLDSGDWVYLRENVLMKDRMPVLRSQFYFNYGIYDRVRKQEYARVLARTKSDGVISYDWGRNRGIQKVILEHYREVRRIPAVRGMEDWRYYDMLLSDVVVYEPIPLTPGPPASPATNQPQRPR